MPTPHIAAEVGQIAPLVLMPGDPKRAERIAHDFLEGPELVSDVRGIGCYTGTYDGTPMSVMASGMGIPSISIYATELYRFYGVKRISRVGTAGGMSDKVKLRDVVVATAAHTHSSTPQLYVPDVSLSLAPSFNLLYAAGRVAETMPEAKVHFGPVFSSDHFYLVKPAATEGMVKMGTLAVEMEAAGLFAVADAEGGEAMAVLTISDHLFDDSQPDMTSDERETSYATMVKLAAEALRS